MDSDDFVRLLEPDLLQLQESCSQASEELDEFEKYLKKGSSERRAPRSAQTRPYLNARSEIGHFNLNFRRLFHDPAEFKRFYRMLPSTFNYILAGIERQIKKQGPRAIVPEERLWITLR